MALPCIRELPWRLRALRLPRSVPHVPLLSSRPRHQYCFSAASLDPSCPCWCLSLELKFTPGKKEDNNLRRTFNISGISHLIHHSPAQFCRQHASVHGNQGEVQVHPIDSSPEFALDFSTLRSVHFCTSEIFHQYCTWAILPWNSW